MKHVINFESITHKEELLINGSGLFWWNSDINKEKKLEIVKWYNNLSKIDRDYVDILRRESADMEIPDDESL